MQLTGGAINAVIPRVGAVAGEAAVSVREAHPLIEARKLTAGVVICGRRKKGGEQRLSSDKH